MKFYDSADYDTPVSNLSYIVGNHEHCSGADVLAVQLTSASTFNFTIDVKTIYADSSYSTFTIQKDVNSKCENCLCASPDCSAKSSSVISIGTDGILAGGVDLACQNDICSFLLSHSLLR